MISKIAIVLVSLTVGLAHAGEPLEPYKTSVCSQLMLSAPESNGAYRGDLHYYLKDMNGVTLAAVRNLDQRELTREEKIWKKLTRFREKLSLGRFIVSLINPAYPFDTDMTTPHDHPVTGEFLEPMKIRWTPANETLIAKMVGRVDQLESDFVSDLDLIAYGFEVRGTANILGYVQNTMAATEDLEKTIKPALDKEFPYATKGRFIGHAFTVGFTAFWLKAIVPGPIHDFATGDWKSAAFGAVVFSWLFVDTMWPPLKQAFDYGSGFVSESARNRYENRNISERTNKVAETFGRILKLIDQGETYPDALVYNGISAGIPTELRTELLEASKDKRPINTEIVTDAIVRDRRSSIAPLDMNYLLVDQIFFFDEKTHEPVLANFIRLKKSIKFAGKKKNPVKETQKVEKPDYGLVPGLSR